MKILYPRKGRVGCDDYMKHHPMTVDEFLIHEKFGGSNEDSPYGFLDLSSHTEEEMLRLANRLRQEADFRG